MPTYEYICLKCGREFETAQSISARPLRVCPKESCPRQPWGRGHVKRIISGGAGLLFKGSGFYITDYRSDGYKQSAKKDSAPAKAAGTSAKPATGSETKSAKPPPKT